MVQYTVPRHQLVETTPPFCCAKCPPSIEGNFSYRRRRDNSPPVEGCPKGGVVSEQIYSINWIIDTMSERTLTYGFFVAVLLFSLGNTAGCKSGLLVFAPQHRWVASSHEPAKMKERWKTEAEKTPEFDEVTAALIQRNETFGEVVQTMDKLNRAKVAEFKEQVKKPSISTHYTGALHPNTAQNWDSDEWELTTQNTVQNTVCNNEKQFIDTVFQKKDNLLVLQLSSALALGITHNSDFASHQIQPTITETREAQALAVFDPQVLAAVQGTTGNSRYGTEAGYAPNRLPESNVLTTFGLQRKDALGGTWGISGSWANTKTEMPTQHVGNIADSVTLQWQQHLLNGGGYGVNLANVRQARLHTVYSQYEFRGYAQKFVADVEFLCWEYIAAVKSLKIEQESYVLTEKNWKDTLERINSGIQPATDRFSFTAQLVKQEAAIVGARCQVETARVALLQKIMPHSPEYWRQEIDLVADLLPACDRLLTCEGHIEAAKQCRTDIAQAKLQIQSGQLDLVKTKNGLLPQLDLIVSTDWNGTAETYRQQTTAAAKRDDVSATVGLQLQYSLGNRAEQAAHRSSRYTIIQCRMALDNLVHLAESDVYQCYTEVVNSFKNIQYLGLAVAAAEGNYLAENERMKHGLSTAFQVMQAQDGWKQMQYQEMNNLITLRKRLIRLYLSDGSLLERRGINIDRYHL